MSIRWFTGIIGALIITTAFLYGWKELRASDQGFSTSCGTIRDENHTSEPHQQDMRAQYSYGQHSNLTELCANKIGMWHTVRTATMCIGVLIVIGAAVVRLPSTRVEGN